MQEEKHQSGEHLLLLLLPSYYPKAHRCCWHETLRVVCIGYVLN